jgi:pyruvate dehydrogenase E2 component (dihydrolipoamide acetyltransferase)
LKNDSPPQLRRGQGWWAKRSTTPGPSLSKEGNRLLLQEKAMAFPLHVPRINNNDDTVRLNAFLVEVGGIVRKGQAVANIETDKATFSVEADRDGYVLEWQAEPGSVVEVGTVLGWLGESAAEPVPARFEAPRLEQEDRRAPADPTLKASMLLSQFDLSPDSVPASGARLTAEDVERYVRERGLTAPTETVAPRSSHPLGVPGQRCRLSPEERGMLRAVLWHRDEAVPCYVESQYDPAPFEQHAAEFQKLHKLLFSPLLALHAWRLAQAAVRHPKLNATLVDGERYHYDAVNLGFTVQSRDELFLVVVENAGALEEKGFVDRLTELERAAMKRSLKPSESAGCTVTFTSMARWGVVRHIPVLPPNTALIVAHSAASNGAACLGATYDHRVLSGFEALAALEAVVRLDKEK